MYTRVPKGCRMMVATLSVGCLASIAFAAPCVSQEAATSSIIPETLKWSLTPFSNVTVATLYGNPMAGGTYAILTKYRAGGRSMPHTHLDDRLITVISGTFYAGVGMEFDESQTTPLRPGTVMIIPANVHHYGWAKDGETIVQEVGLGPSATGVWLRSAELK
jgi:quercetin dioxygenase-like cupin family protein